MVWRTNGRCPCRFKGIAKDVLQLGLPDRFIEHGDPARLLKDCGLDADGIHAAIAAKIAGNRVGE